MSRLSQLISRVQSRQILIIVAGALLILNLSRFTYDHFKQRQETISSRIALLEQYRMSTRKLPAIKTKINRLSKLKDTFDGYLITGKTVEEIESNLQIKLQQQITIAGLEVESLRPVKRSDKRKDKEKDQNSAYGEITIKMRLAGNPNEFIDFLAQLYNSKSLYKIESFTLKPYRKKGLKIFFDYKGYYKIAS